MKHKFFVYFIFHSYTILSCHMCFTILIHKNTLLFDNRQAIEMLSNDDLRLLLLWFFCYEVTTKSVYLLVMKWIIITNNSKRCPVLNNSWHLFFISICSYLYEYSYFTNHTKHTRHGALNNLSLLISIFFLSFFI